MNFDDVTIRVMQENLMPARDGPATIVGVADTQFVASAHEALNVIGTEAKVTVTHRVDELLHLVAGVEIALGPMELNVTVGQKVDFAGVGTVISLSADHRMRLIADGAQLKQCFVELRQTGQVVCTEVHMVELELHSVLAFVGLFVPAA